VRLQAAFDTTSVLLLVKSQVVLNSVQQADLSITLRTTLSAKSQWFSADAPMQNLFFTQLTNCTNCFTQFMSVDDFTQNVPSF